MTLLELAPDVEHFDEECSFYAARPFSADAEVRVVIDPLFGGDDGEFGNPLREHLDTEGFAFLLSAADAKAAVAGEADAAARVRRLIAAAGA